MEGGGTTWLVAMVSLAMLCATASAISDPKDAAALLAFKTSIIDNDGKLGNWKGNDPCGPPAWIGIKCQTNAATNASQVTEIHLLQFNLGGTIAPELGNLQNLLTLDLMWNQITGSIPPELGNLKSLNLLLLNGNKLSGPIPPELGNMSNMNRFQLDDNHLNGTIPASIGNVSALKHLHLNNNSFTGSIPPAFGRNDSNLAHMLLDNNHMSGPLPTTLMLLPYLTIIQLDNNPIGGNIPPEWANMPALMKLSLRNCSLTGSVPELTPMTNLTSLDLSMNHLEGPFPTNFSSKLITIDVSNNNFTGPIPDTVSGLQDIQALEFAYNQFNQSVPPDLGSGASFANTSLRLLVDLRNNSLTSLNAPIANATAANPNVTLWLYGNPVCGPTSVISDQLKFQFCIDSNGTAGEPAAGTPAVCARCSVPSMAVADPPGRCRCAQPIELNLRLKSPSFTFFDRFRADFVNLVTSVLNLTDSQVQLGAMGWEPGPRLNIVLYLFPTNATFDPAEYERLFSLVANWDLSAGTEWALSIIGPYELLEFRTVTKGVSTGLSKGAIAAIAVGSAVAAVALAFLVVLCGCHQRLRKAWSNVPGESFSEKSLALMPPGLKLAGVKAFTFEQVSKATNDFDASSVLGRGGYGNVYKGLLDDGTLVAVKRAERSSLQGSDQFYTEIKLLSRVHHRNLVSLIGFCNEVEEQMLIYEFMPGGNLRDHLKPTEQLDYATRIRIAVGTAKGILYLHTEADPPIFHRDIKASNILLDGKYNAKVADFGLSKLAPAPDLSGGTPEGVSTNVRGTPGYLDPEYFMTNKLTDKSDVYSFGVVLLELLTGMLPIAHGKNIVREVQEAVNNGTTWDLVDPCMGPYPREGVESLLKLALSCVHTDQDERPQMVELTRDLDNIWRTTVAPESPSGLKKGSTMSSNASSFNQASDRWPIRRGTPLQDDHSWISTDGLMENRSHHSIEIAPR